MMDFYECEIDSLENQTHTDREIMKRDLDLLRDLLMRIEKADDAPARKELQPKTVRDKVFSNLIEMTKEDGLIKFDGTLAEAYRFTLTKKGRKFCDKLYDDQKWQIVKSRIVQAKDGDIDYILELATKVSNEFLENNLQGISG